MSSLLFVFTVSAPTWRFGETLSDGQRDGLTTKPLKGEAQTALFKDPVRTAL